MQINTYLYFNGNCEAALNFYKDALHGNIERMVRYGDTPGHEADDNENLVMHAVLDVNGTGIYFSDSSDKHKTTPGDNFAISLSFTSDEDITNTFNAISNGGQITMPLQDTFWGAKFGICTDQFGINWMFNWDKPKG